MINLEVKTKLKQEEVIGRLKIFFGKDGLGLNIVEETPQCITFQGGGGYINVTVSLCPEEGKTRINLVSQEWDYHVKKFASDLP